jgi:hypothetical protein
MSDNNAYEQVVAQAISIEAMVAALNVDYDRLEELKTELEYVKDEQGEEQENMSPQIFIDSKHIDIEFKLEDGCMFCTSLTKAEAIELWRKLAEGITMMELQQIFKRTEIE